MCLKIEADVKIASLNAWIENYISCFIKIKLGVHTFKRKPIIRKQVTGSKLKSLNKAPILIKQNKLKFSFSYNA